MTDGALGVPRPFTTLLPPLLHTFPPRLGHVFSVVVGTSHEEEPWDRHLALVAFNDIGDSM